MGRTVLTLAIALVALLGATVAAQEESPAPTPLLAPDDLTFTLPSSIGEFDLDMAALDVDDFNSTDAGRELWRDLLLPLGKEPSDTRMAMATGLPDPSNEVLAGSGVAFILLRVDGVLSADITDEWLRLLESTDAAGRRLDTERIDIDGSDVLFAQYEVDDPFGAYIYPKGEVMFMFVVAGENAPSTSEVMSELP